MTQNSEHYQKTGFSLECRFFICLTRCLNLEVRAVGHRLLNLLIKQLSEGSLGLDVGTK